MSPEDAAGVPAPARTPHHTLTTLYHVNSAQASVLRHILAVIGELEDQGFNLDRSKASVLADLRQLSGDREQTPQRGVA